MNTKGKTKIDRLLIKLNACKELRIWAKGKSADEVVNTCERGDWLLWLASKLGMDKKTLTLAKERCAKTVIHLMKDERSEDERSEDELIAIISDAYDIYTDAYDAYADSYIAARYSADAYDAYADSYIAARYAADADDAFEADDFEADAIYSYITTVYAKEEIQMKTVDICREIFGDELIELINKNKNYTKMKKKTRELIIKMIRPVAIAIVLGLLAALMLTSCSKKEDLPQPKEPVVTQQTKQNIHS